MKTEPRMFEIDAFGSVPIAASPKPLPRQRRRKKKPTLRWMLPLCCAGFAIGAAAAVLSAESAPWTALTQRLAKVAGFEVLGPRLSPVSLFETIPAGQQTNVSRDASTKPKKHAAIPTLEQAVYLARATLIALDHANRTGNYAVLRELSARTFKSSHAEEQLSTIFAGLRRASLDLTASAVRQPLWQSAPIVERDGTLRLVGTMPASPVAVRFNLGFIVDDGLWKLNAISITPASTQPVVVSSK